MKNWTRLTLAVAVASMAIIGVSSASASTNTPTVAPAAAMNLQAAEMNQLAAAPAPQLQPENLYRPITPCRIVDTRKAGGALANATDRWIYVGGTTGFAPQGGKAGGCGIPVGATAVTTNIAVINPSGNGYLKAFPSDQTEPTAAIYNYLKADGATSTGASLTLDPKVADSAVIRNYGHPVHVVIDVMGYYIPQIQALISGDGSVSSGGARIVSTSHAGTGFYYITLDRPARQCSPSAVTYNLGRYASVGLSSATTPNTISVSVWSLSGTAQTPTDFPFFLTVTC